MKEKLVILRSGRGSTRDPFRGPFAFGAGPAAVVSEDISIEVEEIDRDDLPALTRDVDVQAVAPVMPFKLIEPVEIDGEAQPAAEDVTWGVKAVAADTSPFTGEGIVVAVLDTGIDASHPAFAGVELIQKDFTGEGEQDVNGHGTHCAGTIFGRTTDGTRIGVAPGVNKALIGKVLGSQGGTSDQIVSAIQWAVDHGAHIISMSLGMDFPGFVKLLQDRGLPPELATSRALEGYRTNVQLFERIAAMLRARSQVSLLVAAAGNESRRNVDPTFEIAVSPPAVSEGVISIAALGQGTGGLTIASFSNTGANLSGPGVGIVSARTGGGLKSSNGTSMACPHVAGAAALWAEKLKSTGMLNFATLASSLIGTARTTALKAGFKPFDVGAGLVQTPQEV